jgi:hypothetical protein
MPDSISSQLVGASAAMATGTSPGRRAGDDPDRRTDLHRSRSPDVAGLPDHGPDGVLTRRLTKAF